MNFPHDFWRMVAAVLAALGLATVVLATVPAVDAPEVERVVVVVNSDAADSQELAEYYVRSRGIPATNIVALPMPTTETISWPQFTAELFNPLAAELARRGWIDAYPAELLDRYGRRKTVISGHRISYLVLLRGVPLRIAENPEWKPATLPKGVPANLASSQASVDGELALLAATEMAVLGSVPNPIFRKAEVAPLMAETVVRVARLDGPTPADVRALIDGAAAGERLGLAGRAYVDIGGTPSPTGNVWLESVAKQLAAAGFETEVDRLPTTLPQLARFDAPVLYFGWYARSGNVEGPFTVPGFRFPPGAIAVHIHSYSAQSLRSAKQFWCGPLVARGVAATVGNVHEPYLDATHHLDLLVEGLLRGDTLGAAAYYALPALSWQATLIGDPLYRPFARSAAEIAASPEKLPAELRSYVVLGEARRRLRAGRKDEALRLAQGVFRDSPTVPLGVSVAQLVREVEGPAAGARALGYLAMLPSYPVRDLGAVRAAAQLLVEWGEPAKALTLYEKALSPPPPVGEIELLEEAIRAATKAALPARAEKWHRRLAVVKPPPPPPSPQKK